MKKTTLSLFIILNLFSCAEKTGKRKIEAEKVSHPRVAPELKNHGNRAGSEYGVYKLQQEFNGEIFQDEKRAFSFNVSSEGHFSIVLQSNNPNVEMRLHDSEYRKLYGPMKRWSGNLSPGKYQISVNFNAEEANKKGSRTKFVVKVNEDN